MNPIPPEQQQPVPDEAVDDGLLRANWAVPWSDLMMVMFVLFAALLAAQAVRRHAPAPPPPREIPSKPVPEPSAQPVVEQARPEAPLAGEALARAADAEPPPRINVYQRSREAVREAKLQDAEIVLMDDQSVKVSVQGPMFFAPGKAELRPEVRSFLDRLAQLIGETPWDVHVVGHTDDHPIATPEFPSNWELSLLRASRVARHLIQSGGLAPGRFVVSGRGEYAPSAANADPRSRSLNRRVEIIITREAGAVREKEREGARP
jgi:chemotaxis protein MotB